MLNSLARWYKGLPDQKKYIEIVTAILSVPVLLTVLTLNLNNIRTQKQIVATQESNDVAHNSPVYILPSADAGKAFEPTSGQVTQPTSTIAEECIRDIGPIDIQSPVEGEHVSTNPVLIRVEQDQGEFCTVVWAYRINGSSWSDYDNTSIALYDMNPGNKTIEVKAKSIASKKEKVLTRSFVYLGPLSKPEDTSETNATGSAQNPTQ
jgi:hypothetical protein